MFRRPHGFTIINWAYIIVAKTKNNNFFVSTPIPIRFGNDKPPSLGINKQLGITF